MTQLRRKKKVWEPDWKLENINYSNPQWFVRECIVKTL
jgi:hypothetical protein